jgi:hypothetical protein
MEKNMMDENKERKIRGKIAEYIIRIQKYEKLSP